MLDGESEGFVPGMEGPLQFEGVVPSSLDELVDWLDIAGEDYQKSSVPRDIQHFPTFSTDDKWPI